ncbi:anthrax toxin lethal factor-related metalloendopeptidase [Bacillus cereus]
MFLILFPLHTDINTEEKQTTALYKDIKTLPPSLFTPPKTMPIISSNFLQQLIIVQTSGNYNQQEASYMIQRISKINNNILYALYTRNVRIKLINFPITYLSEYTYLRGKIPRGWEGTGYTWDDVPGIGGNPVVARIGYSNPGHMHSSINLELHETAHAIDNYVFQNISYSQEFFKIHAKEYASFSNNSYYYYPEEYFAEAFAYYYFNDQTNETLKSKAPSTYQFIQNLPFRL